MIKTAAHIATALTIILLLCITDTYLKQTENILPMDTDTALILNYKEANISKEDAIQELTELSQKNNLTIIKIVTDKEDFLNGKDLYSFNSANQNAQTINWYDQKKHGALLPASQLQEANLNGLYMLQGTTEAKNVLYRWTGEHNVGYSILESSKFNVLKQTIFGSGYGIALLCAFILLLITAMGWSAHRIHSKSLRIISGQSVYKIIASDVLSFFRTITPAALITAVIGVFIIGNMRGFEEIPLLFIPLIVAALAFCLLCVFSVFLMTAVALPTVSIIAERKTGITLYRTTSEILKIGAVLLTAISLPTFTSATMASLGITTEASYWKSFSQDLSLRILTASEDNYQENEAKLATLVQKMDSTDNVILSYTVPPETLLPPGPEFDGVILTNSKYLQRFSTTNETTLASVDSSELSSEFIDNFESNFSLWCRTQCSVEQMQLKTTLAENSVPFPSIDGTGEQKLNLFKHPLIINVDSVSKTYQPSFIGPLITTSNILFTSSSEVNHLIEDLGLTSAVLSVDRIADVGLQQGQSAYERALTQIIGLALVTGALITATSIAATVYITTVRRRLFIKRAFGETWLTILRSRLVYEACIVLGASLIAMMYCSSKNYEYSWSALITPAVYFLVSLPAHIVASRQSFQSSVARKV